MKTTHATHSAHTHKHTHIHTHIHTHTRATHTYTHTHSARTPTHKKNAIKHRVAQTQAHKHTHTHISQSPIYHTNKYPKLQLMQQRYTACGLRQLNAICQHTHTHTQLATNILRAKSALNWRATWFCRRATCACATAATLSDSALVLALFL